MNISLPNIRRAVIEHLGLEYKPRTHYSTLPGDVEVDCIEATDVDCEVPRVVYHVRVLSATAAKMFAKNKKTKKPHRIQIFCTKCNRFVFAGKFRQHSKFH